MAGRPLRRQRLADGGESWRRPPRTAWPLSNVPNKARTLRALSEADKDYLKALLENPATKRQDLPYADDPEFQLMLRNRLVELGFLDPDNHTRISGRKKFATDLHAYVQFNPAYAPDHPVNRGTAEARRYAEQRLANRPPIR